MYAASRVNSDTLHDLGVPTPNNTSYASERCPYPYLRITKINRKVRKEIQKYGMVSSRKGTLELQKLW
jgi:hypothetical protein